jgi:transposase
LSHSVGGSSSRISGSPTSRPGSSSATLAVAYCLSKRQIQQLAADLFGLTISTGMISKLEKQSAEILQAPYNELATAVHTAEVIGADETGWREDRHKAWLCVTVTALATVFTIDRNRSAKFACGLLGDKEDQVVGSDRFKSYDWLWAYPKKKPRPLLSRTDEAN